MAKYKQALPRWVQTVVLGYVRGYEDLKAWRERERQNIICGKGESGGGPARTSAPGRPVEYLTERLLALEQEPNARRLAAIDQALVEVGADMANAELETKLQRALLLNCVSGREYPYERFDLPGISRRAFYQRRRGFLYQIAVLDGLIEE